MEVQAINSANVLSFEGQAKKHKKQKQEIKNNYPQQTATASPNASRAMRNLTLGLMALGTTAGALTSCEHDVLAEANSSSSSSSSATANAYINIGGGCHHDTVTIIKPDTIHETDTIIHTVIKPVHVKDYPFHLADSLIAQGMNIGIPIDGPVPDGSGIDSVAYVGSKAHNRYDNKFYESMVDSVDTNKRQMGVVTKVVDMYDDKNPKTFYMKAVINDVPGRGIKITRYIADSAKKPEDDQQYLYNYAGYEIRSNGKDGQRNVRSIFDNNNNLIYQGDYEKGEEPGTFLYGSIIYDPETGEPFYDEDGNPEFAQYDFDQAVIYSDYAKRNEYRHDGWNYGD
ncbi:TPA: hypothetical protein CPT81_01385 [Candidatus Gastranaerophilales bacterium HUM_20]|nr:unknown [Clostridium sp. CAG:729]DAB24458.1 MAG TPA: hypothetical protein CPT81_01385 [Candidatus Gastranaerophilales bacterium HUM_20]